MNYKNTLNKALGKMLMGATSMLLSPLAFAHAGHNHAQADTLSGIVHFLTTHPLLFGVVGLAMAVGVYAKRR